MRWDQHRLISQIWSSLAILRSFFSRCHVSAPVDTYERPVQQATTTPCHQAYGTSSRRAGFDNSSDYLLRSPPDNNVSIDHRRSRCGRGTCSYRQRCRSGARHLCQCSLPRSAAGSPGAVRPGAVYGKSPPLSSMGATPLSACRGRFAPWCIRSDRQLGSQISCCSNALYTDCTRAMNRMSRFDMALQCRALLDSRCNQNLQWRVSPAPVPSTLCGPLGRQDTWLKFASSSALPVRRSGAIISTMST